MLLATVVNSDSCFLSLVLTSGQAAPACVHSFLPPSCLNIARPGRGESALPGHCGLLAALLGCEGEGTAPARPCVPVAMSPIPDAAGKALLAPRQEPSCSSCAAAPVLQLLCCIPPSQHVWLCQGPARVTLLGRTWDRGTELLFHWLWLAQGAAGGCLSGRRAAGASG